MQGGNGLGAVCLGEATRRRDVPRGGNGELLCASGRQRGGAVRGGNG